MPEINPLFPENDRNGILSTNGPPDVCCQTHQLYKEIWVILPLKLKKVREDEKAWKSSPDMFTTWNYSPLKKEQKSRLCKYFSCQKFNYEMSLLISCELHVGPRLTLQEMWIKHRRMTEASSTPTHIILRSWLSVYVEAVISYKRCTFVILHSHAHTCDHSVTAESQFQSS